MGFSKTDKQRLATRLQVDYMISMLFGGSRSGKTFIALRNILIRAMKTKSRHLVARQHFNHVKQSVVMDTLPKVFKLCFPMLPSSDSMMNKSDWYLPLPNGSEIWFGGLDDKVRVEKILGNEYSTIFLNECSQISWHAVTTVMTRLAEKTSLNNRLYMDCNPPSKKHWSYSVFKKGLQPGTEEPIKRFKELYGCLQINPPDNLEHIADGYVEFLEGLPKKARERFLDGNWQDDIEGALWDYIMIEQAKAKGHGEIIKTVIAIDPAVTNREDSDLTGIIAASECYGKEYHVHEDASTKASPLAWAQRAVNLYHKYDANYMVAEVNQGGDMVETVIKTIDPNIKVKSVRASKGKFARAEPIQILYEQGKVSHEQGLMELEGEMCGYVPLDSKKSPDRMDALVWALSDLSQRKEIRVTEL